LNETLAVPSLLATFVLATLQGLTEFLPVSSSGHLAAAQIVWPAMRYPGGVLFEVAVHVGTTGAVLVYYRQLIADLLRQAGPRANRRPAAQGEIEGLTSKANPRPAAQGQIEGLTPNQWIGYILLASVPTAAIGLGFEDNIKAAFENLGTIAVCFAVTGAVLTSTRFVPHRELSITPVIALAIGVIQGAAIFPGISRSGVTISLALLLGIAHRQAVTFSFLLSVPAVLGAAALSALELRAEPISSGVLFANMGFATLCAGAIGYVCIGLVHRATEDRWWHRFAWYLWVLAAVLAWLALGGS
jgi:undecaprenyl-diphosphatase